MTRPDALPVPPTPEQEQEIIEFLHKHPDFFSRHSDVLADLPVRHSTGPAVSLIERQVGVLRDRNARLQERLDLLLRAARDNESRIVATNNLARAMISATSFDEVISGLKTSLHEDFSLQAVTLALFDGPLAGEHDILWLDRMDPPAALLDFFRQGITLCGRLESEAADVLFDGNPALKSSAMVPLDRQQPLGLLAIADADAARFEDGMGYMFLELTASLATAALRHHWPADNDTGG